jgi:hypothetical protein
LVTVASGAGRAGWRPVGEDSKQFVEFFADGKMTEGPNARGEFVEYALSGNELTIGSKDHKPPSGPFSGKTVVSFSDADHMDWTTESKYTDAMTKEEKVAKCTVRFERIKEDLTIPAK